MPEKYNWIEDPQQLEVLKEMQLANGETIEDAKVGMNKTMDMGAAFWTDILRFGPKILATPKRERKQLDIPERFRGYKKALLEAFHEREYRRGRAFVCVNQLPDATLDTFQTTLREGMQQVSDKMFEDTYSGIVFFSVMTNSGNGVGRHTDILEHALEEAQISVSSLRLPYRFCTILGRNTLELITAYHTEKRSFDKVVSFSSQRR